MSQITYDEHRDWSHRMAFSTAGQRLVQLQLGSDKRFEMGRTLESFISCGRAAQNSHHPMGGDLAPVCSVALSQLCRLFLDMSILLAVLHFNEGRVRKKEFELLAV